MRTEILRLVFSAFLTFVCMWGFQIMAAIAHALMPDTDPNWTEAGLFVIMFYTIWRTTH